MLLSLLSACLLIKQLMLCFPSLPRSPVWYHFFNYCFGHPNQQLLYLCLDRLWYLNGAILGTNFVSLWDDEFISCLNVLGSSFTSHISCVWYKWSILRCMLNRRRKSQAKGEMNGIVLDLDIPAEIYDNMGQKAIVKLFCWWYIWCWWKWQSDMVVWHNWKWVLYPLSQWSSRYVSVFFGASIKFLFR